MYSYLKMNYGAIYFFWAFLFLDQLAKKILMMGLVFLGFGNEMTLSANQKWLLLLKRLVSSHKKNGTVDHT